MIPSFPDPYPDELLYSVCARLAFRMHYRNRSMAMKELFGSKKALAIVDLASRLDHLVEALPPGHNYTASRLIDDHTLLPFYSPFLPTERVNRLRQDMRKDNAQGMRIRAGISNKCKILSPDSIRYCPICAYEDTQQFGEPYWHRVHQVPGVEVCPVHAVFLVDSNVLTWKRVHRSEFICAATAIEAWLPRPLDLENFCHKHLLLIARDAAWLLNQRQLTKGLDSLRVRYYSLLSARSLAGYKSKLRTEKFRQAFRDYYPTHFLQQLQCEVGSQRNSWIFQLVRSSSHPSHPLHHLLLIHFLGHTVESFFQLGEEPKPFGEGPWPCLNPASDHFRKLTVVECHIERTASSNKPTGTFSCACGFIYKRVGPDRVPEDQFRIGEIKERGPVWQAALRNMWADPTISVCQMARKLKARHEVIKSVAASLGLSFPRANTRGSSVHLTATSKESHKHIQARVQDKLETYRRAWLEARSEYPEAGREFLNSRYGRIAVWLHRHDAFWLDANSPPIKSRQNYANLPLRVDWSSRDAEFAARIPNIVEQIKSLPGRPVKISISAIGRELGQRRAIHSSLDKLPSTAKILNDLVETVEDFAIRRVQWALERFHEEDLYPQRWQLVHRAALSQKIAEAPQVKAAIDAAMQLNKLNTTVEVLR